MVEDDEFVETSDVEELEELQKNGRRLSKGSSTKSSFVNLRSAESPPRKRMKLFHEDAANDHEPKPAAVTTSSPIKAILSTSRNSQQEDVMTEDQLSRTTISPAKSIFTTRTSPSPIRSQSSSTLPVTTSPSPGFISSRSPTRTPPSGFEDSGEKWDEKVLAKVSAPSPEKPQDSLLLDLSSRSPSRMSSQASPSRPPLASIPLNEGLEMVVDSPKRAMISPRQTMNPSTPQHEFAAPRSQSPDPLSLFHLSPSPSRIQPKSHSPASTSPIAAASSADELLTFSPTRSASRPTSLSPQSATRNTSPAAQSHPSSPARERSAHPSSRPVNPPSRGRTEDDALSAAAIQVIVQEEQQSSRYSLRQRQPAQLRPYTLDQIHYVQALQDNPEAIIKLRNLPLHRHRHPDDHYEEEDETQQDHDAEWEAQERRRLHREELRRQTENERHSGGRSSHEPHCRYDALLPDLPSTDEEDREMDAVAKEARKILRAKEKQRKAKEKEERQRQRVEKTHNPKPYPFSNARSPGGATPGPSGRGASSSRNDDPTAQEEYDSLFSSRGVTPHFSSPGPSFLNAHRSSTRSPSPSNDNNVLRGYFHEDDDFYMDDPNEAPKHEISEITEPESDQPATLPPTSSSPRILHEDVIELDSGDDQPQAKRDSRHSSISSAGSPEILLDLPKSKRRVLGKMMPAFMINKLIQKGESFSKLKPDKRVRSPSPFPEHAGPLAPGETRVRKIANPKDIGDIKGDSESEEELRPVSGSGSSSSAGGHSSSEDSDSDSDDVEILHTYRHRSRPKPTPEVIDLVHHVSASENSSDDDDIQFFVHREKPAYRRKATKKMGDQSLIDWMLPRVRTIGGNRKDRQQAKSERRRHRHRPSGYRIDVMTRGSRGHGKERQTLLSFDKFEEKKHKHRIDPIVVNWRSGTGGTKSARQSAGNQESPFHEDAGHHVLPETDDYVMTVPENGSKLSRKEREKLRRAQAKKNGIYNFSSGGGRRVTTGRSRDNTFFTVDLEDEGFHRALAPLSAGSAAGCEHPKKYEAPLLKKVKTHSKTRSTGIAQSSELAPSQGSLLDQFSNSSQPKESNSVHIAVDLNICRLPSGKSLSPSSYIRRGRLHELTNIVFGNREPPAPVSTILRGYDIGPTMGVEKLCSLLPKLCDSFLDFSGGLPDPDFDELVVQWKQVAHVLPHLVSWYLKTSEETYRALLYETVEREILRLVDELEKSTLTFIDIPVLTTTWFAVDMASRLLSFPSTLPSSSGLTRPLKASSTLLMRCLLQSDIQKVSDVVQSDNGLDSGSRDAYAAELWVCLIHLLNGTMQEVQTKAPKSYAFWTILTDLVQAKVKFFNAAQSLKVSENIWLTIFTVCSLSQFSIHGMTTGEPRLPACWDLVALALKTIRLTDSAEQLRDLNPVKLQLRDRYVGLVTSRCAHLREKWHWRLDDGSPMFNQLAEIFRSRNFANLRHEDEKKMPKFFVARNWEYLSAYSSSETVFSIFLKLIVQAAQDDEKNTGRKSSAKVKKLLSLAVPLGSLPFSKTNPPTRRDFTMYWNRLSAVAVSIFLDQNDYDDRTKKARHYVAFENADYTTRHLIICGIVRLTALLITRGIQVTAMIEWIEHIAKTLQPEVKEFMSKEWNQAFDPSEIPKADPIRLTSHLIASVGQIVSSYKDARQYPTAGLLLALKPLLMLAIMKTEVLRPSLGYLTSEIFAARSLVLPKPPRPARSPPCATVAEEESQESQDFGGIDLDLDGMDWDAPGLAEALGDAPSSTPNPERIQKENALRDALSTTQFKWLVYSHLKQYLQPPPSNVVRKDHVKACDQWLRLWLCCADIETQPTKWAHCLSLVDSLTKTVGDEVWISRVNLSTMYQLLQLDPMAYLMQIDRAMEAFFLALVSCSLDLENGYVSLLLSIDNLAHPLFANATCLPSRKAESGDFEFATEEFVQLRLPLVQVIFRNLNESLLRQVAGNRDLEPENQRYLDLCTKMFSTMRSTRTALLQKDGTSDKLQNYNEFCKQIFSAFEENLQLAKDSSFEFWVGWVRTLAM